MEQFGRDCRINIAVNVTCLERIANGLPSFDYLHLSLIHHLTDSTELDISLSNQLSIAKDHNRENFCKSLILKEISF